MQEKKKKLLKQFKAAVEDLLDNYDKYTDEEKAYDPHFDLQLKARAEKYAEEE